MHSPSEHGWQGESTASGTQYSQNSNTAPQFRGTELPYSSPPSPPSGSAYYVSNVSGVDDDDDDDDFSGPLSSNFSSANRQSRSASPYDSAPSNTASRRWLSAKSPWSPCYPSHKGISDSYGSIVGMLDESEKVSQSQRGTSLSSQLLVMFFVQKGR